MKSKLVKNMAVGLVLVVASGSALATNVWVTGKIIRTVTQNNAFGGCMVMLDTLMPAGNTCPANRWISLDCQGAHSADTGERLYTSALTAFALDKTVTIGIDDTKKINTFCVAFRLDIIR